MLKKIPIGQSDFKVVVTERYYVDKSLYLKDVIDADTSLLVTRPRRFGKTLNMMMLKYFYDADENNRDLFKGLQIESEANGVYMEKCGQHPVLFMSFKDLKSMEWEGMYKSFVQNVLNALLPFHKILTDKTLPEASITLFEKLFSQNISIGDFNGFLKSFCHILFEHYGKKVVILIDEYDSPVIVAHTEGYYAEMVNLMRSFLSSGLKDNPYLEKGVLTGITRISKESMFSGLNNFEIFSLTETTMSDKFGFTQNEVHEMLQYYGIFGKEEEVKLWYNNYQFGKIEIYNPWSILNFVKQNGEVFDTFWASTSDNALVRELMFNKSASIRNDLEKLIRGEWLKIQLEKNLSFPDLKTSIDAVWNLLLFGGYLKYANIRNEEYNLVCEVAIPNKEVRAIYKRFIIGWVETQIRPTEHEDMLAALLSGQVNIFKKIFKRFVESVFSYHDTAGDMPEKFYYSFLLGLLVKLEGDYHIFSNREIGYGRADICLVPKKDKSKLGIIIEIKSPDKDDKETLQMGLEMAEKQIIDKNYAAIMPQYEIPNFMALAISVQGKKTLVKQVII